MGFKLHGKGQNGQYINIQMTGLFLKEVVGGLKRSKGTGGTFREIGSRGCL